MDDPFLTVRLECAEKALIRVILDSPGSLTGREAVFATGPAGGPVWVVIPQGCGHATLESREGVELLRLAKRSEGGFAIEDVLRLLRDKQVMALYVEAVGRLGTAFLESGFVDRLSIHVAPWLFGRDAGLSALEGEVLADGKGIRLPALTWEQAGSDLIATAALEGQCLPD
jgi:riboflavin biosynthesis pyrimidine reductase